MPFLPEVSDICVDNSSVKSKNHNLNYLDKFYETEEQYEVQLLGIRHVPSTLSKKVPSKNIKVGGASEQNARLNPKTKFGVQEKDVP